ncbi:hydrogenase [Ruminiclostridium herbifermentans]|uniref:Hydrogenase n=1 Tax=Ruminiclostridium herbifermentans TaxID=2488810 RepID=A0A4U7JKX6_9FIRM|nr:NifB/NifX family molybdenum-iron cluster-binding protein [Ruminiclostridium herbifermentans]QNU68610.1 hydrogenase [Ruminiclostridium herbifermentans]
MSYKIAIASTDGIHVNAHFRSSLIFYIVEVNDDGSYFFKEERIVPSLAVDQVSDDKLSSCGNKEVFSENNSCGSNSNCGSGSCSNLHINGCGGGHSDEQIEQRVSLISDCRCLLCKKIGPSAERQLARKAITTFQIDNKIDFLLAKIIDYYTKVDNHISLRKR